MLCKIANELKGYYETANSKGSHYNGRYNENRTFLKAFENMICS
jgi:hypothetical protein